MFYEFLFIELYYKTIVNINYSTNKFILMALICPNLKFKNAIMTLIFLHRI